MPDAEAKQKATHLYATTKGEKSWYLNQKGRQLAEEIQLDLRNGPLPRKEVYT